MTKGRLEAFSDGVLAIIITIMVLGLAPPHQAELSALKPLAPVFASYALSFVYLAVYWNNHHHLLQAATHVDGRVLWANMHLLFWLSLVPFGTAWMGENEFAAAPVALYGAVLTMSAVAYFVLTLALVAHHGRDSAIGRALGRDVKGRVSLGVCFAGMLVAAIMPIASVGLFVALALFWFVPDRRLERALEANHDHA